MDSIKQITVGVGVLRIAGTVNDSIVDGEGYRYSIFTQGCPHDCRGCHNPQTHDAEAGRLVSADALLKEALANPLIDGVTFSGGEPFCQAQELAKLAERIHQHDLTVWCYTGFTLEQLLNVKTAGVHELLGQIDVLVDGPYIEAERDLTLAFRGSRNQRVIDLKRSREADFRTIYLYEGLVE